jgi:hypothetical protein
MWLGLAIAAIGVLFARPWWKAGIIVTIGFAAAAHGYWRGATTRERLRGGR